MNHQENLQLIREKCIAANPEIVELKFGCEMERKYAAIGDKDTFTFISDYYRRGSDTKHEKIVYTIRGSAGNVFEDLHIEDYKIHGRPIRLADVLVAIQKRNDRGDISVMTWLRDQEHATLKWNLLKDDLREQSEETVEFIANLLR